MLFVSDPSPDEQLITVDGELRGGAAHEFVKTVYGWLSDGPPMLTIDFAVCPGIGSAAITGLVAACRRTEGTERNVRVRGCSQNVLAVMRRIQLDRIISVE